MPKLAQLDTQRLRGLYLFLLDLEGDFQRLLATVREAIRRGTFVLRPNGPVALDASELGAVDRILAADAERRQARSAKRDA